MKKNSLTIEADPFESYRALQKHATWWRRGFFLVLAMLCADVAWTRIEHAAPPWTIERNCTSGELPTVKRLGRPPDITETAARAFFLAMLEKRYGWSSFTIKRDLEDFKNSSLPIYQAEITKFFTQPVEHPTTKAKTPRLHKLMQDGIYNQLILPDELEKIDCRPLTYAHNGKNVKVWSCKVKGTIVTQSILPPQLPNALKTRAVFFGTMWEMPTTRATPAGLAMANLGFDPLEKEAS